MAANEDTMWGSKFLYNLYMGVTVSVWLVGGTFVVATVVDSRIGSNHPVIFGFVTGIAWTIVVGMLFGSIMSFTPEERLKSEERQKLEEQHRGEERQRLREQIRQGEIREIRLRAQKLRVEQQKLLAEQKRWELGLREEERKKFFDQIRDEERSKLDNE